MLHMVTKPITRNRGKKNKILRGKNKVKKEKEKSFR